MEKKATRGDWIYGRRPVLETLRAGKRAFYELIAPFGKPTDDIAEMLEIAQALRIPARAAQRGELERVTGDGNHQGTALRCGGFPYASLEEIRAALRDDPEGIVLLLDHIEDPQNVGSLIRSANAAGVLGVIIPEDRSSLVTPAAVRASAGASERMRIAKVVNLVRAMQALKSDEVWLTGLDLDPRATPYTRVDFKGRTGIVVGSEGRGLGRLVGEQCDFIAFLPMRGTIESLNAGVAGALVMYEAVRQKTEGLT